MSNYTRMDAMAAVPDSLSAIKDQQTNYSRMSAMASMPAPAKTSVTEKEPISADRYRTCCDCCHIKVGTVFLGLLEGAVVSFLLFGIIQQLLWKSEHHTLCDKSILRDCLIFDFAHFNLTLVFDYIITLLLILILVSILLMFCGIMSDTSTLLFPHLFIQAIFLLTSVGYFVLYAWSYFYGDLYTHKREFTLQSLMERMWLASVLLLIAAFQVYLFFAVAKCSIYLAKVHDSRRERETAFFRTSERVRIAKENGLWRTGGVGGFLTYTRQEEDEQKRKDKTKERHKDIGHVQWSNENKVVVLNEEDEMTRSDAQPVLNSNSPVVSFQPQLELITFDEQPSTSRAIRAAEEHRRKSNDSEGSARDYSPGKSSKSSQDKAPNLPRTPSKERTHHHHHHHHRERAESLASSTGVAKSKGGHQVKVQDEEIPPSPIRRRSSKDERYKPAQEGENDRKDTRTSSSSSPDKDSRSTKTGGSPRKTESVRTEKVAITITEASRPTDSPTLNSKSAPRQLRKLKSVESTEYEIPPEVYERRMKSRRRSSDAGRFGIEEPGGGEERVTHQRHHYYAEKSSYVGPEKKPHEPGQIVKKVSISATVSPLLMSS